MPGEVHFIKKQVRKAIKLKIMSLGQSRDYKVRTSPTLTVEIFIQLLWINKEGFTLGEAEVLPTTKVNVDTVTMKIQNSLCKFRGQHTEKQYRYQLEVFIPQLFVKKTTNCMHGVVVLMESVVQVNFKLVQSLNQLKCQRILLATKK